MTDDRPDPDLLLERLHKAAEKESRARLKIWFGMAPGVGKTYAMLAAARRAKAEGEDIVVGWAETHGRDETAALLDGLEVLPKRTIDHRGTKLEDFDLDAALARKPKTLLLDELPHTNAPGGRHEKRWQDVLDLLDAGIDVESTLNVQHLESLRDVVKEVTGVDVREVVPDHIVDRADEIELIDLPPDELLERLRAGKVYHGEQAARAEQHFFRRGNLLALRELALRRTADRVDADVQAWREEHAIDDAWASNEKILVCVGATPGSSEVVRAARRLADRLRVPWLAVHVEASDRPPLADESRARVDANMHLAESLGAEIAWLTGRSSAEAIVSHARRMHVTRIMVGKHPRRLGRLRSLLRPTLVDALLARAGDLELHVVSTAPQAEKAASVGTRERSSNAADYLWAAAGVTVATGITLAARDALSLPDVVMIYLLAILLVAMRARRGPSFVASAASVLAYNFFFVPPVFTFAIEDWRHLLTFAMMFVIGMLIATLTRRMRRQEDAARDREARTSVLFSLTRDLAALGDPEAIAALAVDQASKVFDAEATILGLSSKDELEPTASTGDKPLATADLAVARWSIEHERPAGLGADALPGARIGCFSLGGEGVLALVPKDPARLEDGEVRNFAELFARQVGLALARARMSDTARVASVRAETEEMRSALLSSVSHDLRTPLAAITGAATTLRMGATQEGRSLSAEVREELLESITDEASRLEQLVANLLDMTRLDAGAVSPHREWVPTEELVGAVLVRFERALAKRPVTVTIHPAVAYLEIDPVLIGQLLANLVENAIKYTPKDAPIEVSIGRSLRGVEITVRDHGQGFPPGTEEHVFERFFRGDKSARGAGLGLAIARAIAHVHGGEMAALTLAGGGAIVSCTLPPESASPSPPDAPEAEPSGAGASG